MLSLNNKWKSILIYAAKCAVGCLVVFTVSRLIGYEDFGWCLISVMLVLSPDGKDAMTLAMNRIKANITGAAVAVGCLFISQDNMWIMSVALMITVTLCYLLNLEASIRSALAATVIIMLHNEGKHLWDKALERLAGVLAGCILALLITFVFHFRSRYGGPRGKVHEQEA